MTARAAPPIIPYPSNRTMAGVLFDERFEASVDRPSQDAQLPQHFLPQEARAYLGGAMDELLIGKSGWEARARRKLINAGALILASIDRLDLENPA